ncbi:MAG: family 16 glycosylhydrolase [Clostridia bacterium]|nr:family 16 glycosylhydrolase [Clostridia bacterium]
MKKIVFLILILAGMFLLTGVANAAPPNENYRLVYTDEFDGDALNTDDWAYRTSTKTGGVNRPENVRVENGMLYIDYTKENDTYYGGGIISKFSMGYGYYETRAKTFGGTGALHTSFWMHGFSESTGRPENVPVRSNTVEIDGFEINSHTPSDISIGSYYNWAIGQRKDPRFHYNNVIDSSADYFIMGFEWLPDRINYYVNGVLVGTHDDFGVYGPSFMWLTALAQPEGREDKIDDSKLPGSSEFDYMRYYQMPIKGLNLLGNGHFEYDRQSRDEYNPRCFYVSGDTKATRSCSYFGAYEGLQCMVQGSSEPFSTFAGHEMKHLHPGKYTFSGMFKGENVPENARLVIYDEDGSVLAEKAIPAFSEWTEVSVTDIEIDGYAFVGVESSSETGGKYVMVDNLTFCIQEGIEYDKTATPNYELYNYRNTENGESTYRKGVMAFKDATALSGNWEDSGIGEDAVFAYYKADNFIAWESKVSADGIYNLEVYRLNHSGNMAQQKYTVYVNDEERASFMLQTADVVDGWAVAGVVDLKKDDQVKIVLSPGTNKGTMRFQEINLVPQETSRMYYTPIFKVNDSRMIYKGKAFFADTNNNENVMYEKEGEYYIPCVLLKECTEFGVTLPEGKTHISLSEVLTQSGAKAAWYEDYLYLIKGYDALTESALTTLIIDFLRSEHGLETKNAEMSTDVSVLQTVEYNESDALKEGVWGKSSASRPNYYNQGTGRAAWVKKVPEAGVYKLQFCTAVHTNSTPAAPVDVYTKKTHETFLLNEKTGVAGWYDVGSYELEANETFSLVLSRKEPGVLRMAGVRLHWVSPGISVSQQNTAITVTLSDFAENQKGKLFLAEYSTEGFLRNVQSLPAAKSASFTLQDANNNYKIFLWENGKIKPVCDTFSN